MQNGKVVTLRRTILDIYLLANNFEINPNIMLIMINPQDAIIQGKEYG